MKKGLTELVFILDESGSMSGMEADTIGGFNSMIDKQRREAGEAYVSTVAFANESRVIHDRVRLDEVAPLTRRDYTPGGCTALLDALGGAIHHIGNVHSMENASRRYTKAEVRSMVERQKEKYGWEFLFLGANIDAISAAEDIGIRRDRSVKYVQDTAGMELNYRVVGDTLCRMRMSQPVAADWKAEIEADEKARGR